MSVFRQKMAGFRHDVGVKRKEIGCTIEIRKNGVPDKRTY
ncbi:hypothetical protein B4168_0439 [Anoxybacillus flavithermus]|nr:hypothetical protein B4168_0439 [Anoxybacillus flavithermus]OAO88986.1 hypothetical protein GT23_0006 [Parageobacillus thermoglucosidasius]